MATISAPNHSECGIDCDGDGYAYYVEPYGPCLTGCVSNDFPAGVARLFQGDAKLEFSGKIVDFESDVISRLAQFLGEFAPSSARPDLDWLLGLANQRPDLRTTARWSKVGLADFLNVLATATGRNAGFAAT